MHNMFCPHRLNRGQGQEQGHGWDTEPRADAYTWASVGTGAPPGSKGKGGHRGTHRGKGRDRGTTTGSKGKDGHRGRHRGNGRDRGTTQGQGQGQGHYTRARAGTGTGQEQAASLANATCLNLKHDVVPPIRKSDSA